MSVELYPVWPNVRCVNCGKLYEMITPKDTPIWMVVGNCPDCGTESFNTTMVSWQGGREQTRD